MFTRWLATTLVVLQTLMTHVSEDILLSRIDQSGFRPRCANRPGTPLLPIEVRLSPRGSGCVIATVKVYMLEVIFLSGNFYLSFVVMDGNECKTKENIHNNKRKLKIT